MIENRRVRFATLDGFDRDDLALISDIWLADICAAPWASRESLKLAAIFMQWIREPSPTDLDPRQIEDRFQISREEVQKSLVLLKTFGLIEAFTLNRGELKASLRLGPLQKLKVLESKRRMSELLALERREAFMRGKKSGDGRAQTPWRPAGPSIVSAEANLIAEPVPCLTD